MSNFIQEVESHYKNPAVRNADNDLLGQLRGSGFTIGPIGQVDEVNGRGAEEIQGFVATRHELVQLAKYWAKKAIAIEYDLFLDRGVDSTEIRLQPFAWRRVSRIAELVGKEEADKAVQQAYDEFGKKSDPEAWNIFLNGTPEERYAFHEEMNDWKMGMDDDEMEALINWR